MHTTNNLYDRLIAEKNRLGVMSLRTPTTAQELLAQKKFERVMNILWKRYEYGIDKVLDEYRRQDQFDEVKEIENFNRRTNGK